MKSIILFSILMIGGIIAYSQELKDTSKIIVEYSNNTKLNMYRFKDIPHFGTNNAFKYPSDPYGKFTLAADGRANIDNAIVQSFSKKTMNTLKGKIIMLSLKVNGKGEVMSVMLSISDSNIKKNELTKKEIFLLIQNIKNGVRFDTAEDVKSWPECSLTIPHRVK